MADSHALRTRSPLCLQPGTTENNVRLACVKHIASVHSEPGSNSVFWSISPVDDLLVGYRLSPITVSGTAIGKADHPTSRFLRLILIPRDFENLRIIDARSTIDSYS